ncbi:odorant receptor 13a-like [Leptopilina boulardi]|uniref:odorant receptor 13a-like n=1 Tax=Leptopilina boulardi TaxID=63433 RepID=UPI0021F5FEF7|nr:odorant receptor 13a-like [Leptopilina boulardi]
MVELFEISYYRLNKILLSIIGQWPFQSIKEAYITFIIMIAFLLSQLYLQVTSMLNYWPDMEMVVESLSPLIIASICTAKISNCIMNKNKMKNLLRIMQNHWTSLNGSSDIKILRNYANDSQKMTMLYTRILYGALVVFMIVPTLQSIAENVLPGRNQTYPLLFPVDNVVNVEKYHKILLIHSYVSTFYFITILISVDTMFITYVTHGCGMFAVLGHQLKNVSPRSIQKPEEWCNDADDEVHRKILIYIKNHIEVLHFAELLQSTYSTSFLFQMGINIAVMSVTGVQIVMNLDNPDQAMRWLSSGLGQVLHLYMNSLPCQRLIDHSISIQEAIYSAPWYTFPLKTRHLIKIILMRVFIPCQITAGKLYVMSMESFSVVLKTSMSYFTVLLSMR